MTRRKRQQLHIIQSHFDYQPPVNKDHKMSKQPASENIC